MHAVKNQIEIDIADVLLEVPLGFSISGRQFYIYPMTLGKSFIVERLLSRMGLTHADNTTFDAIFLLKAIDEQRQDFIKLIAYYSLPKDECLDLSAVNKRMKELEKIEDRQIATLVSIVLSVNRVPEIRKHFGFDEEKKRLDKVMKAKNAEGNNVVFGGKSIWGSLIDFVAERYGWTLQYILWGISYSNLSLLMEDHVRSVYLTDEEMKKARLPKDNILIKADDKTALEDFISTQTWR